MLVFDPSDPFPLLEPESHSYPEAQSHSQRVDAWLGLETERVEEELIRKNRAAELPVLSVNGDPQQLWTGLPVQALLTPYTEIRTILDQLPLRAGQTVVDLGAGYGRMGFVIDRHFPDVWFVGYELVLERVHEGQRGLKRAGCNNAFLERADLGDPSFVPLAADYYFLYDFGARWAIEKSLDDLKSVAVERAITVVGRGRSSRDAIERNHPWLSQVIPPNHFEHYSIYRSAGMA